MRGYTQADLEKYRAKTFRLLPKLRLHFQRDAINFVNERGFIFFWPVKNVLLPSLWVTEAVRGEDLQSREKVLKEIVQLYQTATKV